MVLVRDIMRKGKIVKVGPSSSIREAVKVMSDENVGSVLVFEGDRLVGIFTERDLVHHVARGGSLEDPVERAMTKDVITLREDESAWKAATIMVEKGIRHLPVLNSEGRVVGVVSIRDALRMLIASSQWP
jgi:CBS domain-containing protein